jgi:DNA-binding transcriptional ArsR family regulator
MAHPIRAQVLQLLAASDGSPSELAESLGASLTTVSYHFRILTHLGFLELVETIPRRGAIEHRYRATARVTMIVEPLAPPTVEHARRAGRTRQASRTPLR